MLKWKAWNGYKWVFALYLLQIKRFRCSRLLIENWGPSGINKSSKLKFWVSKVAFVEMLWGSEDLSFMIFGVGKKLVPNPKVCSQWMFDQLKIATWGKGARTLGLKVRTLGQRCAYLGDTGAHLGPGRRERRCAREEKEKGLLRTVDWVFKH